MSWKLSPVSRMMAGAILALGSMGIRTDDSLIGILQALAMIAGIKICIDGGRQFRREAGLTDLNDKTIPK